MVNKLLLVLSCIIAVVADVLLVWWSKHPNHPIQAIIWGVILNTIGMGIWTYTMKEGIESATAITFYALFTVTACSLVGTFVFHEHLSIFNIFGIFLAIISLIMICI